jgi:acyl dehydratase
MTTFASPTEMDAAVGSHLGYSDWLEITQERINLFADATSDHQWIHVDPQRAKNGPFGTPVAPLMGINYGANKVRFITPVPVGSKLRAGAVLAGVEDFGGGRQVTLDLTFEIEGNEKPACVAQVVYRFYG